MFFVINKEKVIAYIVSILTIVILFCATNIIGNNTNKNEKTQQTSANAHTESFNTNSNLTNQKQVENVNLNSQNKNIMQNVNSNANSINEVENTNKDINE